MLTVLLRLDWPSVVIWGASIIPATVVVTGLATWSWSHVGGATMAVLTLYAALVVAIALWGELDT